MASRVQTSARHLLPALTALLALGLVFALAAAPADAASKKKKAKKVTAKFPTISSITPERARVGETLTIRGKNYLVGKKKTTVVFKRDGKKPIFVKATLSTKTMLKVEVPKTLETMLSTYKGYALYTKFRVRIGAKRFGKRYTANKLTVGPVAEPGVDIDECARVRLGNNPGGDLDGDFLTNAEELGFTYPTNPCAADTDGDTLADGWEFFSAKDLNQAALPYPRKRPFPNPLDPDQKLDYDGDGLRAEQEFALWNTFGRPYQTMANRNQLLYSDGTQTSSGPGPDQLANLATLQAGAAACGDTVVPPSLGYLGRGYADPSVPVEDDEKDADHDGLNNWAEANGFMTQAWWKEIFAGELPYPLRNFADTDPVDADVDGDGCIDGLDDQDADDWPNWMEHGDHQTTWVDEVTLGGGPLTQWLPFAGPGGSFPSWAGWADAANNGVLPFAAHPFNPCLPETTSRTCSKYVRGWPPFNDAYQVSGCEMSVTYRARAITVWVWDAENDGPWAGSCPP